MDKFTNFGNQRDEVNTMQNKHAEIDRQFNDTIKNQPYLMNEIEGLDNDINDPQYKEYLAWKQMQQQQSLKPQPEMQPQLQPEVQQENQSFIGTTTQERSFQFNPQVAQTQYQVTQKQTNFISDIKPMENDEESPAMRNKVNEIKKQLTQSNVTQLTNYGVEAQTGLSKFSNQILSEIDKNEIDSIDKNLTNLMKKLGEVDPEQLTKSDKNIISKLFNKAKKSIDDLISKYQSVSGQVDQISLALNNSKNTLLHDNAQLDYLFETNKAYYNEIDAYIKAADESIIELNQRLENMMKSVNVDEFEINDLRQFINRLEKRSYDLKLSRQISLQTAPQIRMIQDTNNALAEKIQSSILTSIPLWKNQMSIAISLVHQQKASHAQRQVTDMTNQLLIKNSEMLKTNTILTAKENERGIVEIETLKKTQANLIDTIKSTIEIQQEGSQARKQAEIELKSMEKDLKNQLLQIQQNSMNNQNL